MRIFNCFGSFYEDLQVAVLTEYLYDFDIAIIIIVLSIVMGLRGPPGTDEIDEGEEDDDAAAAGGRAAAGSGKT